MGTGRQVVVTSVSSTWKLASWPSAPSSHACHELVAVALEDERDRVALQQQVPELDGQQPGGCDHRGRRAAARQPEGLRLQVADLQGDQAPALAERLGPLGELLVEGAAEEAADPAAARCQRERPGRVDRYAARRRQVRLHHPGHVHPGPGPQARRDGQRDLVHTVEARRGMPVAVGSG